MKINKLILLALALLLLTPSLAAGGGTRPHNDAGNSSQSGTSTDYTGGATGGASNLTKGLTPGDCFILNNCHGNPLGNVGSADECVNRNGNSWVDEEARCISDIDQD